MPATISSDILAYIGAGAVAWIVLRLVCAPYFIWTEQTGEIGTLKLELSRPQQIEFRRLAKLRAKNKVRLAAVLRKIYFAACNVNKNKAKGASEITHLIADGISLMGQANVSEGFGTGFALLTNYCFDFLLKDNLKSQDVSHELIGNLLAYLHGDITGEVLALRLPPNIGEKKLP